MAGRTKRGIRDQDAQGLKCLRKIRPLLSRLLKVGSERDRAGPMIRSLLDLQRACALDKVRKRFGVSRASLESLSESVAIFDPAPFKEIVAELSWTPKAKGKHLSAYRLHKHFEVLSGKAVRIDATSASPKGDADERAVLQRTIEADRCYILDRGSISERL